MRICLVILLLGVSCLAPAQSSDRSTAASKSAHKTYTSPNRSFQFTYPALLIRCEKHPQQPGYLANWTPEECAAYSPTCDMSLDVGKKDTLVCVAYPRNEHTDTRAFEAGTFSVAVVDAATTASACLPPAPEQNGKTMGPRTIHGIQFTEYEASDAGMSHGVDARIYRALHGGTCYELAIAVASQNPKVFDPPEREQSSKDIVAVNGALEQTRDSFRFLK